MSAYYNENDPYAAQWLRNLVRAGLIADGEVDERSIEDVQPADLAGFSQCHFFGGIGGWSHALRLAGHPDAYPVWTASLPCQPWSVAGQGRGANDERHLWPVFFDLVRELRPPRLIGEQVASPAGLTWLDLVFADLEGAGYACGAADLSAAGLGAPHIRQRLFWVADTGSTGLERWIQRWNGGRERLIGSGVLVDGLADAPGPRPLPGAHPGVCGCEKSTGSRDAELERLGDVGGLADAAFCGCGKECQDCRGRAVGDRAQGIAAGSCTGHADRRAGPLHGGWQPADWLYCRDGKWRPVEPGSQPLAARLPGGVAVVRAERDGGAVEEATYNRVGALRGFGNAIVPPLAAEFIRAYLGVDHVSR